MNNLNYNIQDLTTVCNDVLKELTDGKVKASCNPHGDCVELVKSAEVVVKVKRWELLLMKNAGEVSRFLRTLLLAKGAL